MSPEEYALVCLLHLEGRHVTARAVAVALNVGDEQGVELHQGVRIGEVGVDGLVVAFYLPFRGDFYLGEALRLGARLFVALGDLRYFFHKLEVPFAV